MAFDTSASLGGGAAGPFVVSYTTTGSNLMLIVGILQDSAVAPTVLYGVTAFRVSAGTNAALGNPTYYIWLASLAVAAGTTANITVTAGAGATDLWADAASYTNHNQSNTPDAETGAETTSDPYTMTVTTIADNCWLFGYAYDTDGTPSTAGANTILRQANTVAAITALFDSNGARTPAGSQSLNVNGGGGPNVYRVASFAPAAGAAAAVTFPDKSVGRGLARGIGFS